MNEIKKRVDELTKILNEANYNYYVLDNPTITDQEYDKYLRELINIEKMYPKYAYPETSRKYKGIGSCMLDFLKNFYKKTITLNSDFKVTEFYTRNKFHVMQEGKFDYIWNPENL